MPQSNQPPLAMPGPQFDYDGSSGSRPAGSWQKIVIGIIIVLVCVGSFFFYQNYQKNRRAASLLADTASPSNLPTVSLSPVKSANAEPVIRQETGKIVAVAQRGNGKTHLARAALKEYLKDKPELKNQLSAAHRIYIEDYLQKKTRLDHGLQTGDEITFSEDEIALAVAEAQKLTDQQLENLSRYVPLVPSINY